ncbi:YbaB/EbfC family nucleoid-associated protein [Actinophytocola sediminis]
MLSSMHNDLAQIFGDLQKQRADLTEAMARMQSVTGTATTRDRMLKATVDGRGRLTELVLRGDRWRELSAKELSAKIVDVVTRAQDKATSGITDVVAGMAPEGLDVRKLMEQGGDPDALPDFDGDWESAGDAAERTS